MTAQSKPRALPRAFVLAAMFLAALVSTWPTTDPDLWWHLADGRYFLANGVPQTDPFSLTMRGADWVAHEWLADILMFRIEDGLGLVALPIVIGLLVGAGWLAIYVTVPGEPFRKLVLVGLAGVGVAPVVAARPQMSTLVLLALLIVLTERIRSRRIDPAWFWLLVPMVALWANLHAGFYTAFAYLAVVGFGSLIDRRFDSSDRALDRGALLHLGGAVFVAFFAILLTPHGSELWTYPFGTLGDPVTQRSLVEWRSPNFSNLFLWPYLLYVSVGLVGVAVRRPRPDATDLLLYAGTLAASLFSVRHIALHAVVSLPVLIRLWAAERETNLSRVFTLGLLVVSVAGYALQVQRVVTVNDAAVAARFPIEAVEFLVESGLDSSRIYNDFPWGGYLLWKGIPPYIDGRTDMYGPEYLEDMLDTLFLREGWERQLDRFEIETALLTHSAPLTQMLEQREDWDEVYRDDQAVVFVRAPGSA